MMKKYFGNTFRLVLFVLKKDWLNIVIWLGALVAVTVATATAYSNLYSSQADILAMSAFFENPAMIAMMGRLFGKDNITTASLFSASMLVVIAIVVGIMNIFFVVRNTRADEEKGRIEVLRSLPLGRLSNLSATMVTVLAINLVLATAIGLSLTIVRLNGATFGGAILFGYALGGIGVLFAAVSAVFCQLSSNSKSAVGLSLAVLGLMYILRAVGDIGSEALAMISPLGMILRTQCFVKNTWWPMLVVLGLAVGVTAFAFYLNSIRDLEQGLVAQRKGKKEASRLLRSPEGLALRLTKNTVIAWAVGLLAAGASYGSILGDLETFIAGSNFLSEMLIAPEGHTKTEIFLTMIISMLAIAAAIPSSGALIKLANEEKQHRYDNILSKAVSKHRVMSGYLVIGLIEGILMLFCGMMGLWVAAIMVMELPMTFVAIFNSFMVYIPAMCVIMGLSAAMVGVLPSKAGAIMNGYLGYTFTVVYLGAILSIPEWVKYTTPYGVIPKLPIERVKVEELIVLVVIGVALTVVGYIQYRRRDIL